MDVCQILLSVCQKISEEEMTHYFWSENCVSGNIMKWFINKWSLDSIEGRKEGKSLFHCIKILFCLKLKARGTQLIKTKNLILKQQQQSFIEV